MKVFKFEVTEQEDNVILAGLGELQLKVAQPVQNKLLQQANEQLQEEKPQPKAEPKTKKA